MKAFEEQYVTQKPIKEAEIYLKKNEDYYRTKILKPNKKHQTIVKADYGPIRGFVLEVKLFPQESTNLTEEEFVNEASLAFNRRNEIDYENIQQVREGFKKKIHYGKFHTRGGGSARVIFHIQFFSFFLLQMGKNHF